MLVIRISAMHVVFAFGNQSNHQTTINDAEHKFVTKQIDNEIMIDWVKLISTNGQYL